MTVERADLDFLHGAGACFVLLRDKEPTHKWTAVRKTAADAFAHVQRGGQIAIVPLSLGNCAVIDVDGATEEDSRRAARGIVDWLGCEPDGWYKSQSGIGRHLWYRCGPSRAPLGYRKVGAVLAPRKLSGGLQWDGPDEKFDLRWATGYVRIDSYARDLAIDMRRLQDTAAAAPSRLAELDARGQAYKLAGGLFG